MSLHPLPGSLQAKQLSTFTLNAHWGRAAKGKKSLVSMSTGLLRQCLTLCYPVDCGLSGFSIKEWGFSRQEYWSVLANTGFHTLLELCISCYPSCQLSEYLVLPEPLQPKQLDHLHTWPSQGKPNSPGKPQEQTPVDNPHVQVEIKSQLNPGAVWLRKKTQNFPTGCTSCRLNPYNQLGRLCLWKI